MKIDRISLGENVISLKHPFVTSLRRVEAIESIIVRIESDTGLVGYGETAPTEAITGENRESIVDGLDRLSGVLVGHEISDLYGAISLVHSISPNHPNACAAMEIALYDLAARDAGVPLVEYLGGSIQPLKTGVTISLAEAGIMAVSARQAVMDGFESLKIKLGSNPDQDLKRVKAIYEAVGDSVRLKLDANQGWSISEAIEFLQAIEAFGIPVELIEQPLPRDDLDGLAELRKHISVPILVDESVFTLEDAIRVLAAKAADMINIKLDKCGGISEAIKIADLCAGEGIPCMMGCMLEGAVSVSAAAHVAAAHPETITMIDLDAPLLCTHNPVQGGVVFGVPEITIPDRIGLGIDGVDTIQWAEEQK